MVEAACVELFSMLTARKLLILHCIGQKGKKGPIAESTVRLVYENLFASP
jgi:hypothetical protein